jgi:hypothetical protein
MKRKTIQPAKPAPAPKKSQLKTGEPAVPVSAELLEHAKRSISADRLKKPANCGVCNAETLSADDEPLCWVCRRLKISAWREIEQQAPVQE